MKIIRMVLAVSLMAGFTLGARADDASKRSKIEEMLIVLNLQKTMDQVRAQQFSQVEQFTKGMFPDQKPLTPSQQQAGEAFRKRVETIVSETLAWDKLRPAFVDLYASAYSEEEVDGILTFYKSPVGQSVLAKTPELMRNSQSITQARMEEMQPKMRQALEDFSAKMKEEQGKPGTAK